MNTARVTYIDPNDSIVSSAVEGSRVGYKINPDDSPGFTVIYGNNAEEETTIVVPTGAIIEVKTVVRKNAPK